MTFAHPHPARAVLLLTLLMLCAFTTPLHAQTLPPVSADAADLLARARAGEMVRVIVGFDAPFSPSAADRSTDADTAAAADAIMTSVRASVIDALAGAGDAALVSEGWSIPYMAVEVDAAALDALLAHPLVTSIAADVAFPTAQTPTPTAQIGSEAAWSAGYTGAGQTIAIIDTGVERGHSAFGGRVVAEACYSVQNAQSSPLCPNGNTLQTGAGAASPSRCLSVYPAPSQCEHGTHIASIAAGNDTVIRGVAPGANVIAVQANSAVSGFAEPQMYVSSLLNALNYVYGLRATYTIAAVNISMGGVVYTSACDGVFTAVTSMVATLRAAGIATVAAAGNGGDTGGLAYPACVTGVISVGATDQGGGRAGFSNSNPAMLTLFAPGVNIYAAMPSGYAALNGTSTATPHVSGAIALLRSAAPSVTVDQMVNTLRSTGTAVSVPGGSTPRINVAAAFSAITSSAITARAGLPGRAAAPSPGLVTALSVRVTRASDGALVHNATLTTDQNGRITLTNLAAGTYRVRVKAGNTLAAAATIAASGSVTLDMGTLPAGDGNNDNVVSLTDFSLLAAAFGTTVTAGAGSDFNGDGQVSITDFSLMAASFGTTGAGN